jgi:hypothetical protein
MGGGDRAADELGQEPDPHVLRGRLGDVLGVASVWGRLAAHTSQSTVAASTVNTGDGPPIRRTWITVSDCKSAGRSVDTRADPNRADGTVAAVVNSSVTGGYTRRQRA